ncbi:hypothetical protein HL658_08705 [Azospirillum sp. RWY-5-1]|uniref:Uncharacterized protein n=1 Tax=Azospirillum oleiclasticum TaxID=2735135 RepID=A0ABX2T9G7_9PROT|nr:hypothetical protein [Azospirillum oleiclasticum]NYZ12628.1 hypothetical protein [Azospirillum oleiclasticum]NYZ19788.1 hypothetical protein [Azospirillum oleiclasticum]
MDKDQPDDTRKPEKAEDGKPQTGPKTGQKIDEKAQEEAAEERKEGGYQ